MAYTLTHNGVPIGWADLIIVRFPYELFRDHTAIGWGEFHPYESFESVRPLMRLERSRFASAERRRPRRTPSTPGLEILDSSNTPLTSPHIYLHEVDEGKCIMAMVSLRKTSANVGAVIGPIPRSPGKGAVSPADADKTATIAPENGLS
jgi:hypothetical protein